MALVLIRYLQKVENHIRNQQKIADIYISERTTKIEGDIIMFVENLKIILDLKF